MTEATVQPNVQRSRAGAEAARVESAVPDRAGSAGGDRFDSERAIYRELR
jgi:hypothetical protein